MIDDANWRTEMGHLIALPTQGVDEQEVDGGMQGQHNGAGHHLGSHNLLCLKVVGGCDVSCKAPDAWQRPPVSTDNSMYGETVISSGLRA